MQNLRKHLKIDSLLPSIGACNDKGGEGEGIVIILHLFQTVGDEIVLCSSTHNTFNNGRKGGGGEDLVNASAEHTK